MFSVQEVTTLLNLP